MTAHSQSREGNSITFGQGGFRDLRLTDMLPVDKNGYVSFLYPSE